MRLLPEIKKLYGQDYIQLKRSKHAALYYHTNFGFEVFVIKWGHPPKLLNQAIKHTNFPKRELFPLESEFGYTAWSSQNYKQAVDTYEALQESLGKTYGKNIILDDDIDITDNIAKEGKFRWISYQESLFIEDSSLGAVVEKVLEPSIVSRHMEEY